MRMTIVPHLLLWSLVTGTWLPAAAEQAIDVPMDRKLTSLKVLLGWQDKEPGTWEGTLKLNEGRIVATDGWRFLEDDYVTVSDFKLKTRRFYPRFWSMHGRDPSTFAIEPNGFILTFAETKQSSVLELSTNRGDFTIAVGKLGYGAEPRTLEGNVSYQKVPTYRHVVEAPTEDAYPCALAGEGDALHVAYIAFTHGKGFERRPPLTKAPKDFAFLAAPTGGDQLMFTEMVDGKWTEPLALTDPGGDLFGTALARDGQGRLWVFWAQNDEENWDLYAAVRTGAAWSKPQEVFGDPGSDFGVVATTDSDGRVWIAWQHLGPDSSRINVSRQEGDQFVGPELKIDSDANEWAPAIAAAADGQVAVAWDTYERGNYDVKAAVLRGGKWEAARPVATSLKNETRPSLAFDQQNRLWVAYEVSSENWGKDWGPYDNFTSRDNRLYSRREVGVRVLDGDRLLTPEADLGLALPMPQGTQRWPKSPKQYLATSPKIAVAEDGRVWLSVRNRMTRFDSQVGGTWLNYLVTLDGPKWRSAFVVPGTDGFLHETASLAPGPNSGVRLVSASDGRFRTAATFGLSWQAIQKARKRSEGVPPASTRTYATYPDWQFNKEISVADTGGVRSPEAKYPLVEVQPEDAGPSRAAKDESAQVAAIRAYRAEIDSKPARLWRGEFHRHTELSSDGTGDGTIFDMWRYAMDMASLDWLGSGDHDNGGGREFTWWITQKTTSLFQMPGTFTGMYTYERSCNYPDGHRNAVFAQRGIRPLARLKGGRGKAMDDLPPDAKRPSTPDTQMFYRYLHQFGGLCASHTSGTDMGTDWRDNDPVVEPVVEIYQGDRQNYEKPGAPRTNTAQYSLGGWRPLGFVSRALKMGYRLGFQSSSDHISTHMSYCNVWVEEPTREAVVEGMKKRHVYGSTDNIIADVRCNEHFMGDEFTVKQPPTLKVKLLGTAPFAEVVLCKDDVYVYSSKPNKREVEFEWTDTKAEAGKTSYYYLRGTQAGETSTRKLRSIQGEQIDYDFNNGEIVWVSPMWITYQP